MLTILNNYYLFQIFFYPLAITIFIEVVVACIIGFKKKEYLSSIVLINIITNPIVVFLYYYVYPNWKILENYGIVVGFNIFLIVIEILVVTLEYFLLSFALKKKGWKILALSVIINTVSYFLSYATTCDHYKCLSLFCILFIMFCTFHIFTRRSKSSITKIVFYISSLL